MTDPIAAWEALHRAQITVQRSLQNGPEFSGISFREYDALCVLARAGHDGLRLNRLNDHLPITQSTLSRLTERLERRGLVERWQDTQDLRGLRIRLSEYGAQQIESMRATHHARVTQAMSALSPEELDTLAALADKLRAQP